MLFNREAKKIGQIVLRPHAQADDAAGKPKTSTWLYYPYRFMRGGRGYIALDEDVNQTLWRVDYYAPFYNWFGPPVLLGGVSYLIWQSLWLTLLGAVLGLVLGEGLRRLHLKTLAARCDVLEYAPAPLTRLRYYAELAITKKRGLLWLMSLFWLVIAVLFLGGLFDYLPQADWTHGPIFIAGFVLVGYNLYHHYWLLRGLFYARRRKLKFGDPLT